MTPYQQHSERGHRMTAYSPNGVDIVEECECGVRFLHNPAIGHPVTLANHNPLRAALAVAEEAMLETDEEVAL